MSSTRRQFLRVAMAGAATLPLAGKIAASDLLTAPTDLLASDAVLLNDIERAAQTALEALKALGYQGMSMDFAVRGVCADCATATSDAPGLPA